MKTIKYIFAIFILPLSLLSCNDWLDLEPSTNIINNEETIKLLTDADYRLNGVYNLIRTYEYYGARMTYYGDATGEDMQAVGETKRVADYYTYRYTKDNAPSTYWTRCYQIIDNTNIIIASIDNLKNLSEADEKTRLHYKGQALTMRALAHFDLTRLYGYPYTKDNGASLGVPIVDKVVPVDYKPKRNTVAECYNFILTDLKEAVDLMKEAKSDGKFNKWSTMLLLSRVYLYKGDNANALKYAQDAITGAEKNKFRLWTNAEYTAAWAEEFGPEVLWEIAMTATENAGNEAMGYLVAGSGYDDIVISDDWFKVMTDKNDVRYKSVINNTSSGTKSGRRYMWKYPRNGTETAYYLGNIKVLRLSEAYLIAAEAAVKLNDNASAVKYLDPIVKRGNPEVTVAGTTITLDRVLEERRRELVGEGHRMFDAIRNHKHIVRSKNNTYPHLSRIVDGGWDFDWTFNKVVLAIPQAEMNANGNMRDQQNPGY